MTKSIVQSETSTAAEVKLPDGRIVSVALLPHMVTELEATVRKIGEDLILVRFTQGIYLLELQKISSYGDSYIKKLAVSNGYHPDAYYTAMELARYFNCRRSLLEGVMTDLRRSGRVTMHRIEKDILRVNRNPRAHGGDEGHKDFLLSKAEVAAAGVQEALDQYPGDPEVEGAVMAVASTGRELLARFPRPSKDPRQTNDQYLAFVRQQGCFVCARQPAQVHHVVKRSSGAAASDYLAVPLCAEHHTGPKGAETLGKRFEGFYGANFVEEILRCLVEYIIAGRSTPSTSTE